ncbi:MAG: YraN family protein [Bacteroidaceae bacterium]|nr:YraN family protein [Bacteroidaceae bacterium]MBR5148107.1 YraN family protein [Bacteroidaceae bacterium]
MAQHNEFGQISEDRAVAYLMARGYTIRDRNWRMGHKEIDIVAQKNGTIAFIEVKARKNDRFGDPVDAITDTKIRNLAQAANAYLRYHRIDLPARFDVIVIIGEPGNQSVEHIEDAFYPPQY